MYLPLLVLALAALLSSAVPHAAHGTAAAVHPGAPTAFDDGINGGGPPHP